MMTKRLAEVRSSKKRSIFPRQLSLCGVEEETSRKSAYLEDPKLFGGSARFIAVAGARRGKEIREEKTAGERRTKATGENTMSRGDTAILGKRRG